MFFKIAKNMNHHVVMFALYFNCLSVFFLIIFSSPKLYFEFLGYDAAGSPKELQVNLFLSEAVGESV